MRQNVQPGRHNWSCLYCKCNPRIPVGTIIPDVTHKFKRMKKRADSKYAACPEYDAGVEFKKQIIANAKTNAKHHTFHIPISDGVEYRVHRSIFAKVFNIGRKAIERCKKRLLVDGRAGNSGRRAHTLLREQIKKFWLNDVDKEPSHYCSTKGKQWCVGVTSVSHGFLMFLGKYFTDKFNECVAKQYFPGLHKNLPPSLRPHDVPVMACDDCIAVADGNNLAQVVCPHMPKFNFSTK